MTITLDLGPEQSQRLTETAERLNVTVEEFATAVVRDIVGRPEPDFEQAAKRVLEKNRELYRRLS